jgi:hypothetical protein
LFSDTITEKMETANLHCTGFRRQFSPPYGIYTEALFELGVDPFIGRKSPLQAPLRDCERMNLIEAGVGVGLQDL